MDALLPRTLINSVASLSPLFPSQASTLSVRSASCELRAASCALRCNAWATRPRITSSLFIFPLFPAAAPFASLFVLFHSSLSPIVLSNAYTP